MLFKCNYNVKDLQITSTFYLELLKWWSELREDNALNNDWHYVICFSPIVFSFMVNDTKSKFATEIGG